MDSDFLARAIQVLGPNEIDALAEIMLECALGTFPMQSAAAIVEVAEILASAIKAVAVSQGAAWRHRLNEVYSRLNAGTLMSRF